MTPTFPFAWGMALSSAAAAFEVLDGQRVGQVHHLRDDRRDVRGVGRADAAVELGREGEVAPGGEAAGHLLDVGDEPERLGDDDDRGERPRAQGRAK